MTASEKRKLADLTIKRLKLVYINSEKIAKMFESDSIAVKGFNSVIDELKVPENGSDFLVSLNKVFEAINHAAWKFAEVQESTRVPLEYIKILTDQAIADTKKALV